MLETALTLPDRTTKVTGDAYLKFRLNAQTPAAFSMRSVQEAIVLPSRRLAPLPNMPAPMMGLMNRRSRVIWVVDLAHLLGLSILDANAQQYTLILIQAGSIPLALAVQQVEGMMRLSADQLQSPTGRITAALVPYLRACAVQAQETRPELLLILDPEAIVQSPILRHSF